MHEVHNSSTRAASRTDDLSHETPWKSETYDVYPNTNVVKKWLGCLFDSTSVLVLYHWSRKRHTNPQAQHPESYISDPRLTLVSDPSFALTLILIVERSMPHLLSLTLNLNQFSSSSQVVPALILKDRYPLRATRTDKFAQEEETRYSMTERDGEDDSPSSTHRRRFFGICIDTFNRRLKTCGSIDDLAVLGSSETTRNVSHV
ncbi:hypothetical protein SISNIDRAFT_469115 [Sistotremastrum niveocremeum HHB9708]|uniref:Uncharacterized protein n=1 Tax=Sistotremastrum niveocremeum HHB9708 TaxID=1314777 RepID=A0A164QEU7_9AGAM|nr:hypothetical protein SISNIDRAFT_469115 [Sistotremastrum niveocremeum HHB9708]